MRSGRGVRSQADSLIYSEPMILTSVNMWSRAKLLLTDPRMATVWVFTVFLIIVFSVVSARPWNDTAVEETTKNLQECEYFQADGREILKYDIDDIKITKCVDKIWEKLQKQERKNKRKERKRKRKHKKSGKGKKGRKGRKRNKKRNRRPRTKSAITNLGGARAERRIGGTPKLSMRKERLKRQRKMFLEQEEFRKWKRKISVASLLSEPVAQEAINDLWSDLIARGPEWKDIYNDMHSNQDSHHIEHHNKFDVSTSTTSSPTSSSSSSTLSESKSTTIPSSTLSSKTESVSNS